MEGSNMAPIISFWKLNRSGPVRKPIVGERGPKIETIAMLYEYVGYVKSESTPGLVYHTVVRIQVDRIGKTTLTGYTCECKGFTFNKMCKHIRALYNAVERDARNRAAHDLKDIEEAERLMDEARGATFSLEL
jgi:hypothetical protein